MVENSGFYVGTTRHPRSRLAWRQQKLSKNSGRNALLSPGYAAPSFPGPIGVVWMAMALCPALQDVVLPMPSSHEPGTGLAVDTAQHMRRQCGHARTPSARPMLSRVSTFEALNALPEEGVKHTILCRKAWVQLIHGVPVATTNTVSGLTHVAHKRTSGTTKVQTARASST